MKIIEMARRLDALAENMKDLQIEGTTRIDWHCLTERERLLFQRILEIREKYGSDPPEDVLQEHHALFNKGIEISSETGYGSLSNCLDDNVYDQRAEKADSEEFQQSKD